MCESMISATQVAEMLGVSVYTVYRLKDLPDGIPAYRVGHSIRFKPADVAAYLAAQAIKPIVKQEGPNIRRFHYVPGMKVVSL